VICSLRGEPYLTAITKSDNMITRSDRVSRRMSAWETPLLERLFTSRVRVKLITLFVLHPEREYHIRALESVVGARYSAIWKELKNLEQAGLLLSKSDGGRRVFRLNPSYPLLGELRSILLKTVAAGDRIRQALADAQQIQAAFIFGSFAGSDSDAESDIDLMVIGDVDLARLSAAVSELESNLAREVNYVLFTPEEWHSRLEAGDPFSVNVLEGPKVMLIGSEDALRGTA